MNRRKSGLALITILSILVVLFAVQWALAQTLDQSRNRLRTHRLNRTAESMAISGLDYGAGRLARTGWRPAEAWRSPSYEGAWFELEAVRDGGAWKWKCTGVAGDQRVTLERRVP